MKKYLAAAVVAVMVFAFAAFAAELDVNGGVLQAGVDDDLTCTESVTVESYRVEVDEELIASSLGARATGFEGCEGTEVWAVVWDENSEKLGRAGPVEVTSDQVIFSAWERGVSDDGRVPADLIESISITMEG